MALAALAGVVLNLLLPQKLEPEELATEEERIPLKKPSALPVKAALAVVILQEDL
jgi:hypothetical protein